MWELSGEPLGFFSSKICLLKQVRPLKKKVLHSFLEAKVLAILDFLVELPSHIIAAFCVVYST